MEESKLLLSVKNLSVKIQNEKILDGISFDLKEKENLVVLGPNGAGKSVLLRSILNLTPHTGEVLWRKDARIAYIPQGFFPSEEMPLTAREFFALKKCPENKAMELLSLVGLGAEILNKEIGHFSGGQFQRLMIAWSLAHDPHVLIFDEPTSGIDVLGEETIYAVLRRTIKNRGLSSIIVTHDMSVVHSFADNVLCLNREAVCIGIPEEALTAETINRLYGGGFSLYAHNHNN